MASLTNEILHLSTEKHEYPRFDVVSDESDHQFAGKTPRIVVGSGGDSGAHKKIMQEWKILDRDLPESVYVRVYETRLDLLRAAIIGAPGTPYHDGLFFFDIAFPPDYPTRPPLVHFRSFGYRINPNLYANGRVCLSLLNTWTGKKIEKWDPKKSTILQVLLSIQALVLNEKPYFNEPGYSGWSGRTYWEKKSSSYNQDVFVSCCKMTLILLRKPPKNFEGLVNGHFKDRAGFILSACDAYRKGVVRVGNFDEFKGFYGGKVEVSSKFKEGMDQVYGQLAMAFAKTGASVGHFVEQVVCERETAAKKEADKKKGKKYGGVGRGFVKKLKKIFLCLTKEKSKKSQTNPVPVSAPLIY